MAHRIEVVSRVPDARAAVKKQQLAMLGVPIDEVRLVDVYTIDAPLNVDALETIASLFAHPLVQRSTIDTPVVSEGFDHALEIGFLPGVTDNVGTTAKECIEDRLNICLEGQGVYSSQLLLFKGALDTSALQHLQDALANPVIQRVHAKQWETYVRDNGMGTKVPRVHLTEQPRATLVDILGASDEELVAMGKSGIANADGTRRGPLALDFAYMKTIQHHCRELGRNPRDAELEVIAQRWSEHCKHTIFADPIDAIEEGLFKRYIKRATEEIRRQKGARDFCVSVFTDNAGAITFDETMLVTDKVETHNTPSALDPFGGAGTGIVGVNRDAIGCGLGAKPIVNGYGFCFSDPRKETHFYRGEHRTQPLLSPRQIMNGVIRGVEVGGNCSGIPTPLGFMYFDDRFRGKPLVFVRTLGLLPREQAGRNLYEKGACPGDYIVMVGGRVGKDGIHGATFSSEALDTGSPATAVQICDPITQKKMSDALVKEARNLELYTSITDNGAGGLSCSVGEMARESGGCDVDLDKVPLKYLNLQPWEIVISESQERMTLSVPPSKWDEFSELTQRRGVEATVVGTFTNSGRCVFTYQGQNVVDLAMNFLDNGLPSRPMKTTYTPEHYEEPPERAEQHLTKTLENMLSRLNIASMAFVSQQYDHEVQGGSVLKPLQGRALVNADAVVVRPVLQSRRGVVLSHGINPSYSDIDTYWMAANAIDTAVRNAVAAGASLEHLALLDNFCWCSSTEPERLGQLKRACAACYDTAVAYGTPYISGKDSMFNDFKGFDAGGNKVKISVPPTLLVSSLGVMTDVSKAVSLDFKCPGDLIYVLGETSPELGGSEYYALRGEEERGKPYIGNHAPLVDTEINLRSYRALEAAIGLGLLASAQSVHRGGLGVALAKSAMGGMLGVSVSLELRRPDLRPDEYLFSESSGRVLVSVNPDKREAFENICTDVPLYLLGSVSEGNRFIIEDKLQRRMVDTTLDALLQAYRAPFAGF